MDLMAEHKLVVTKHEALQNNSDVMRINEHYSEMEDVATKWSGKSQTQFMDRAFTVGQWQTPVRCLYQAHLQWQKTKRAVNFNLRKTRRYNYKMHALWSVRWLLCWVPFLSGYLALVLDDWRDALRESEKLYRGALVDLANYGELFSIIAKSKGISPDDITREMLEENENESQIKQALADAIESSFCKGGTFGEPGEGPIKWVRGLGISPKQLRRVIHYYHDKVGDTDSDMDKYLDEIYIEFKDLPKLRFSKRGMLENINQPD